MKAEVFLYIDITYFLIFLYNHNQKLAYIYNRFVHMVKMRMELYERLTRYGKYGETISDILDRVFMNTTHLLNR